MLEAEPTPTLYVTGVTERLHPYSRTCSDLKKWLPLLEKKIHQKLINQNFQKSPRWGLSLPPLDM